MSFYVSHMIIRHGALCIQNSHSRFPSKLHPETSSYLFHSRHILMGLFGDVPNQSRILWDSVFCEYSFLFPFGNVWRFRRRYLLVCRVCLVVLNNNEIYYKMKWLRQVWFISSTRSKLCVPQIYFSVCIGLYSINKNYVLN